MREFKLERYFARYEFDVEHLLSPSDCENLTLSELLSMADEETWRLWENLKLTYSESPGHPLLREEISRLYSGISPQNVLVAAPEEAIFVAMNTILRKGDHFICLTPAYQSLFEIGSGSGCKLHAWPLRLESGTWRLDLEALRKMIIPRTRLLVINFPHNPSGFLPTAAELEEIVAIARRHDLILFSDEMYRFLELESRPSLPGVCDLYEKGVSLGGVSKSFSLPGLRIGWLAGRDQELLDNCLRFKDYTTICNNAPGEILAIMALRAKKKILAANLRTVHANRAAAGDFFAQRSDHFEWLPPQAGSVALARLRAALDVDGFCAQAAARHSLMILPGSVFDFPGNYFRVGLGRRNFTAALQRLGEFCDSGLFNPPAVNA